MGRSGGVEGSAAVEAEGRDKEGINQRQSQPRVERIRT